MTIHTIQARNVHQAFPQALDLIDKFGVAVESRNGTCLQVPTPVVTTYLQPQERVIFWDDRDANPFFHLYEALWMLAGRNDVHSVANFAKQIKEYSDDGETIHGAYGHRWRRHFGIDQLDVLALRLYNQPNDRRSVLQMWDANSDLDRNGKDVPCNTIATFQILNNRLNMTVFCRSNDIVWGAYGANAVHFSMLQEYMATRIGCEIGEYHQVSVNWHGYLKTLAPLHDIPRVVTGCPYAAGHVRVVPMTMDSVAEIPYIVDEVTNGVRADIWRSSCKDPWSQMVRTMMKAHWIFKTRPAPEKYTDAILLLQHSISDWHHAGSVWLTKRYMNWERKMYAKNSG